MLTEDQLNAVKASIINSLFDNDTFMQIIEDTIFTTLKEQGIDFDSLPEDYSGDLCADLVPSISY